MLKKKLSSFRLAALGLAVSGSMLATQQATAFEVEASAAVSNMYFWRGQDLGNGSPAISGDIVVSQSGAYAGIWGSSGDDVLGNEYDLFAGYGGSVGDFSYDISVWNYVYPNDPSGEVDAIGTLSEVIASVGFGPATFTYYDNVAGGAGYEYYTLEAGAGSFSGKVGFSDSPGDGIDYYHLDLTYSYNDNLSFTVSKLDNKDSSESEGGANEDTLFVVAYSLPIDLK